MKSVLNIHWGGWCWSWNSNTLATWCEELTHWKRPWCWERLKAGGEGDNKGQDGWMASLTQWTWVWVNSESWNLNHREAWRAAVHGVTNSRTWLSDWAELNWIMIAYFFVPSILCSISSLLSHFGVSSLGIWDKMVQRSSLSLSSSDSVGIWTVYLWGSHQKMSWVFKTKGL